MRPGSDAKEKFDKRVLRDLTKLSMDRCRDAFITVAQLMDDDAQRYTVLIAVICEMMSGCESLLERGFKNAGEKGPDDLKAMVIRDVLRMLDYDCEFGRRDDF